MIASSRLLQLLPIAMLLIPTFGHADGFGDAPSTRAETSGVTRSTTVLSDHERARSRVWDLSAEEWLRYRTLMEGIRGSVSPATLSPIEALGIHARDESERRRYAERWARMMREDAERILAFQRAYDEAGRRLYPSEPLIDLTRLPYRSAASKRMSRADRLLLFVAPGCAPCDALVTQVLSRIERVAGVDLFLSGIASDDDAAVRAWAADRGIRPEWVSAQRVTLNHDRGTLKRVAPGETSLPVLLLRRGNQITPITKADL
jgi:integrating conjugative element protein (TIGR03759 family)